MGECISTLKALAIAAALLCIGLGCVAFLFVGAVALILIAIGAVAVFCIVDPPADKEQP